MDRCVAAVALRVIPACAGNCDGLRTGSKMRSGHPCVCGAIEASSSQNRDLIVPIPNRSVALRADTRRIVNAGRVCSTAAIR